MTRVPDFTPEKWDKWLKDKEYAEDRVEHLEDELDKALDGKRASSPFFLLGIARGYQCCCSRVVFFLVARAHFWGRLVSSSSSSSLSCIATFSGAERKEGRGAPYRRGKGGFVGATFGGSLDVLAAEKVTTSSLL